jgi:hypothetical protein
MFLLMYRYKSQKIMVPIKIKVFNDKNWSMIINVINWTIFSKMNRTCQNSLIYSEILSFKMISQF